MRLLFRSILLLAFVGIVDISPLFGQSTGIPREHHLWGRFAPGAWKLVRAVNETFADGQSLSTETQTQTTLTAVGPQDVTLRIEVAVELHGKRINPPVQVVSRGFHGGPIRPGTKVSDLGRETVTIQNQAIPCSVQQLVWETTTGRVVTKLHYSPDVFPYVLRREMWELNYDGQVAAQTTVEVTALNVWCKIQRGWGGAHVKAVRRDGRGTTTIQEVISPEVPGGVECQRLEQVDMAGQVVRRSSLEMLDYGLTPKQPHAGSLLQRLHGRRFNKRVTD